MLINCEPQTYEEAHELQKLITTCEDEIASIVRMERGSLLIYRTESSPLVLSGCLSCRETRTAVLTSIKHVSLQRAMCSNMALTLMKSLHR